MENNFRKIFQKQVYDILSHRYGLITVFIAVVILIVAAFHFGETMLEWSHEKYAAVFNSYSDNIAEKSFRERLCQPVPIDVVYTWVNGSDPELIVQLRNFKLNMEAELNISREEKCVFTNCLATNMIVLDPQLPNHMTLEQLMSVDKRFQSAERLFSVTSPTDEKLNFTVIEFRNEKDVKEIQGQEFLMEKENYTMTRGFITSDWTVHNSILLSDLIIMSGFPHKYDVTELKEKFPDQVRDGIEKIEIQSDSGLAVLHVPDKTAFNNLLTVRNISIDGKEPTLNAANLVWDLRDFRRDEDISSSRFEDNEELRYSLRSIEKYAPWVRHVYIITNGQIPHWLNLEYPRVSIITHEELFTNKSHLPTFSSPAIEAHIHRIPGLSQKFIYMNDDVMFGKEVWPDDFYTNTAGQKVYLTWPVPNCNEGCPSSWIKDGYCDKACNNTECEWDGGDCEGQHGNQGVGHWSGYNQHTDEKQFCNKGCANNWLADRYCDTACNVHNCGYDVGDCGTDNFGDLYQIPLYRDKTMYKMPPGEIIAFFNLTNIVSENGRITAADYNKSVVIRSASVANKFKVITVLLYPGKNRTMENFFLKGHTGNTSDIFEFHFTLTTETRSIHKDVSKTNITKLESKKHDVMDNKTNVKNVTSTPEQTVVYDIPEDKRSPHIIFDGSVQLQPAANLTKDMLPPGLAEELDAILQMFNNDEITQKGFNIKQSELWKKYQSYKDSGHHISEDISKDGNHFKGNRKLLGLVDIPVIDSVDVQGHHKADENKTEYYSRLISNLRSHIKKNGVYKEDVGDIIKMGGSSVYETQNPWEKVGVFTELVKKHNEQLRSREYMTVSSSRRRLLDTFGDSLRHVNKLYNRAFGFTPRKVPGHMPHMVDKIIMEELQDRFVDEWATTSSNKIRSGNDMQFAFSYFYYLMGVSRNVTVEEIFDDMDTDKSKVLSDREIRTFATRLYELPLDLQTLSGLENIFMNCSRNMTKEQEKELQYVKHEQYYENSMPQVTRSLFTQCDKVQKLIQEHFTSVEKYKYTIEDDTEIAFKMIKTNISTVVGQLDDIRKSPKKFVCLNDDIEHGRDDAKTVKAILQDFYESQFPIQSKFELPRDYRNRFLKTSELQEWKAYRDWLKFWTHLALIVLVLFTIASFFGDKIEAAQKKYFNRRKRTKPQDSSETSEDTSARKTSEAVMTV